MAETYLQLALDIAKSNQNYKRIVKFLSVIVDIGKEQVQTDLLPPAMNDYEDLKKALRSFGVDLSRSDVPDATALHWAVRFNHAKAVKMLLLSGSDVDARDGYGQTALHYSAVCGSAAALKVLLLEDNPDVDIVDKTGCTALHLAVLWGRRKIVDMLLEANASPRIVDVYDRTPVDFAFEWFASPLTPPELEHVLKVLARAGANMTKRDSRGRTTLHVAATSEFYDDNPEYIYSLVAGGMELESIDNEGNTALHYAAMNMRCNTFRLLSAIGANLKVPNDAGLTPLDCMLKHIEHIRGCLRYRHEFEDCSSTSNGENCARLCNQVIAIDIAGQ